jgi:hypothetical protein
MRTMARMLNSNGLEVDVLCVVPPYVREDESANRWRYEQRTLAETTRILDAARVELDHCVVHLLTETGSPAVVIADKTAEYDLTVIGPRGTGFRIETAWALLLAGWRNMPPGHC